MLEVLSNGFNKAKDRLKGRIELTEENINEPLKDIRLSLLEADVNLTIIKKLQVETDRIIPATDKAHI